MCNEEDKTFVTDEHSRKEKKYIKMKKNNMENKNEVLLQTTIAS